MMSQKAETTFQDNPKLKIFFQETSDGDEPIDRDFKPLDNKCELLKTVFSFISGC